MPDLDSVALEDWPTRTAEDWGQLQVLLDGLAVMHEGPRPAYLFRGQVDARWSLVPSLARLAGPGPDDVYALRYEDVAASKFLAQAHEYLHSDVLRLSDVEIWGLMQHYRAPTRLLDWSASPYVGAYFAVEGGWEDIEGALWAFRADLLAKTAREVYLDDDENPYGDEWERNLLDDEFWRKTEAPPQLFAFRRGMDTDRMVAQQGCFTACRRPLRDHAEVIGGAMADQRLGGRSGPGAISHLKVLIPSRCKPEFLGRLRAMNIAAHSLFPGIDGIGRSLAELLRLKDLSSAFVLQDSVKRLPVD